MKLHINTPLIESLSVGKGLNGKVWLKLENCQPCGSFKARGVGYACHQHVINGAKKLVTSSGGNAGLAVAYAGRVLNIPVTVVVPTTTKISAINLIKEQGAEVVIKGDAWDEAHQYGLQLTEKDGGYIHPFDDPLLWEGHSTLIDEVIETGIKPDAVVLSVGGGGLLSGIVKGLRKNKLFDVPVIAVETDGASSLAASMNAGKLVSVSQIMSVASSLGAKKVSQHAFELTNTHPIYSHIVTDKQAIKACSQFLNEHRYLVEPACGASLAAVYDSRVILKEKSNILIVVCGGVGINTEQLKEWSRSLGV
ncbi:pyridoxal-phosphate dependent enzyme [Parashewanella spongiae]|uniref:L-serine ammonia-lyase n=1 Tax=Parashewanella spongiae TaxID=342950 RepID=A0A3A6U371_9GAMM|nr:pyridoxal-phosphate dependent enzyme [Parashewanella spongiae]MCL1078223.1 pyridoxal-phosphate dependent enzyme [Parashewanella spongiae]RJY16291.1 pyridoxal-phosphate dependent enzyme [Parashewanella spongiae]